MFILVKIDPISKKLFDSVHHLKGSSTSAIQCKKATNDAFGASTMGKEKSILKNRCEKCMITVGELLTI